MRLLHIGAIHPHAPLYRETIATHAGIELVGAVDAEVERARSLLATEGVTSPVFASAGEALASVSPDAVLITLPNRDTPEAIRIASQAGLPILCEKPGARTATELEDALAGIASPIGFAYLRRVSPVALALRDLIADGILGDLVSAQITLITANATRRNQTYLAAGTIEAATDTGTNAGEMSRHWMFDPDASGGGIVHWLGVHFIDLLRMVTGDAVTHASATYATPNAPLIGVEEIASATLEWRNGMVSTLSLAYALPSGPDQMQIAIQGTHGWMTWDGARPTLRIGSDRGAWAGEPVRELTFPLPDIPGYGGALGWRLLDAFRETVESGLPMPTTAEDAVRTLGIVDALGTSARSGNRVAIDDRET